MSEPQPPRPPHRRGRSRCLRASLTILFASFMVWPCRICDGIVDVTDRGLLSTPLRGAAAALPQPQCSRL
eukprot:364861-Chlamydomonas_euryale.AAC.28